MSLRISSAIPRFCPYSDCQSHSAADPASPDSVHSFRNYCFRRKGYYRRTSDSQRIPRFVCLICRRSYSSARYFPCFRQKRRTLNPLVKKYLNSAVSQRRLALTLGANRKTIVRKFLFLAKLAHHANTEFQKQITDSDSKIEEIQFDEMESFERSKCLPLSIPIVVDSKTRKILGFRVCVMPAKGPLAEISRKKYGRREDQRAKAALSLLAEVAPLVVPNVKITTDQKCTYSGWIKKQLPEARHKTTKGRRGCAVGYGELKKIGFDPLFSLNHSAAMIRANVNRLLRRTWCTTKKRERLEAHLALYVQFHNEVLTA